MRVVKNDAFIKQRVKFAQRGSLIGMGMLLGSLFLSWQQQPLISWLLLIGGFVVAMASARVGNRYIRPPRPDTVLDKVLKGLDNKYTIYHFLRPAEHLLLTPSGLIVLRMQEQRGRVVVRGKRWRHQPAWQRLRTFLGEEGLGNPAQMLRRDLAGTARDLAGLPGGDGSVPVEGIIVFYHGKTELDAEGAEYPVVLPEDLRATVRAMAEAHQPLGDRSRKALAAALGGEEPPEEPEPEPEPPAQEKRSRKVRRHSRS